ncbi:DUF402 domain-containing protein [Streptomyces hirsutus]|uniref:DUF402 domain-containing protein n=1 Tax=Streptomyces hirsutus TaxID=35620 RepID=UPI0036BF9470
MRTFETGQTVVRRDVHGSGRVWSEHALRVVADTSEALVTACLPGAETRWPALYVKARADGDRSVRTEAFDAMATGTWELADAVWQETELLWKPPAAWFSVNAFYTSAGLRNWYVNFERPIARTGDGFDTFDLTVDLVIDPDLTDWQWKDEDEYAHVRRLGIVTDTEHQAVDAAAARSSRCSPSAPARSPTPPRGRPGDGTRPGPPRGCRGPRQPRAELHRQAAEAGDSDGQDVSQLADGGLVVVPGRYRFVQVLGALVDQADAVAVRERGQGGDRPEAGLFAVAFVMGAGRGVDVQQGARHGAGQREQLQGTLLVLPGASVSPRGVKAWLRWTWCFCSPYVNQVSDCSPSGSLSMRASAAARA